MKKVLLNIEGPIARITLNRPELRNALDVEARAQLLEAARTVEINKDIRCLILGGNGAHFMGGADVKEFADLIKKPNVNLGSEFETNVIRDANQFCQLLERAPFPVISSIRGAAAGGGFAFACAGDFLVASETAFFISSYIHVGFSADGGLSYYLQRLVGTRMAKKIMMFGEKIKATEGLELGFVDQVVPDAELESATEALAQRLAALPRQAIKSIKRLVNQAPYHSFAEHLQMEAEELRDCAANPDFIEGVTAFQERRKPAFNQY
jgi:2-(1,2-epoxy-1,2-dihydrophenyl)acetyl-CoA isomerase